MKATYVSYKDTHSFSKLSLDYLAGEPSLYPFYKFKPSFEGLEEALTNRKFKGNRLILKEVLLKQYADLETSDAVRSNIEKLADEGTYTITTGHQLNIFTGPLYFIYKIVSAIKLAAELAAKYPHLSFVPIYWMASEDHDFLEINHVNLGQKKITWEDSQKGATGKMSTVGLLTALKEFQAYLGLEPFADEISAWMQEAYTNYPLLADATRYFVNKLFESYGLVILNPDDAALKRLFSPILKAELVAMKSHSMVEETTNQLVDLGYKSQIHPREINLFYLQNGLRERIEYVNGRYQVNHTSINFNQTEILQELELHPENFSPNVVLRPVYQELILPNIAYIGGAAEVAYWMQLKAVFDLYEVDFPVLLLRNSALLVESRAQTLLNKLYFSDTDIFAPREELIEKWLNNNIEDTASLTAEKQALQQILTQIQSKAGEIDATLVYATKAATVRIEKIIGQIEHKLFKAQKNNHAVSLNHIDSFKNILFPQQHLQERYLNIVPFYAKYGPHLITQLYKSFNPLAAQFTLIHIP
ncbi:MAG: bacillithiol biosynthesis cysteine-adding enzyme BshC [Pedobacter sp.]|nr:MAG: bacillithiol biosynthesis cysteine-adding enzyme BshC [Pedobacter sp.]